MANNTIVVNAMTQGLSQVIREMTRLQQQLAATQSAANGASGAQNGQAGASRNQSRAANDAAESIARLNSQHTNAARQMSDMARSSSASIAIAYAEIAATIFTLSAAFNFLKNAAQYDNMIQAQRAYAAETGTNLGLVAKKLQEASGYAIDFAKASGMASIGKTAGFTSEQMKDIAKTAKTAAIILGRDLPDAIDRAFRGVAKGEPEILDELGIFIRLGPAYKAYAESIGVAEDALTSFQQKQAIYYAFAKSGKIYQGISNDVETDPFSKAQAQFMTSVKELTSVFTRFVSPFVEYLSANKGTLIALALLLGGKSLMGASKAMFNPTVFKGQMEGYKALIAGDKEVRGVLSNAVMNKQSTIANARLIGQSIQQATNAAAAFNQMGLNTNSRLGLLNQSFQRGNINVLQYANALKKLSAQGELNRAFESVRTTGTATIGGAVVNPAAVIAAKTAFDAYRQSLARLEVVTAANAVQGNRFALALKLVGVAAQEAMTRLTAFVAPLKLVAITFMSVATSVMGVLGLFYMLWEAIKVGVDLMGHATKGADKLSSALTSGVSAIAESAKAIDKHTRDTTRDFNRSTAIASAYAGTLEAVYNATTDAITATENYKPGWLGDGIGMAEARAMKKYLVDMVKFGGPEVHDALQKSFMKSGTTIEQFNEEIDRIFDDNTEKNIPAFAEAIKKGGEAFLTVSRAATALDQNIKGLAVTTTNYLNSLIDYSTNARVKTSVDATLVSYKALKNEMDALYKVNKDATRTDEARAIANESLRTMAILNGEALNLSKTQMAKLNSNTVSGTYAYMAMSGALKYLNKDYEAIAEKERAAIRNKEENANKVTTLSKLYNGLSLDIDSLTGMYNSLLDAQLEYSVASSQLAAIKKKPGLIDPLALDSATKAIEAIQLKIDTITKKDKSINIMEQLFGKPVVEDINAVSSAIEAFVKAAPNEAAKKIAEVWGIFQKEKINLANFKANTLLVLTDIAGAAESAKKAIQAAMGELSEIDKLRNNLANSNLSGATRAELEEAVAKTLAMYQKAYDLQIAKDASALATVNKEFELRKEMNKVTESSSAKLSLMFSGYSSEAADAITAFKEGLEQAAIDAASTRITASLDNIKAAGGDLEVSPEQQAYADAVKVLSNLRRRQTTDAKLLADAEMIVGVARAKAIEDAKIEAKGKVVVTQADKDLIKAHQDAREAIETTKTALQGFRDAITEIAKSIASVGNGKGWSVAGKDMKESAFKGLDKIKEKFSKDSTAALKDVLGKKGGIVDKLKGIGSVEGGKLGGLGKLFDKIKGIGSMSGVLSGIANIAQGNKGVGAGQLMGALIGGPLGAMLGGMIGGAIFGQKVLKAVGIQAQINNFGQLTAQEIAVYKKKGIGGSKTSTSILGSLASETMLALQDAITNIRSGFISNINQLSVLSLGALSANEEAMKNFSYSGRFTTAPDAQDKNALYDALKKGYGDAMVNAIAPMIKQFTIANEGFANTLERLVHIVKVADNTFNTVFFKGTGKGLGSVLSGEFLTTFSKESLQRKLKEIKDRRGNVGTIDINAILNTAFAPINDLIGRAYKSAEQIAKDRYLSTYDSDNSSASSLEKEIELTKILISNYKGTYEQFAKENALFIGYLTDPTNPLYAPIRELAKIDFYNKMYASFAGANIEEKTKNFDAAMSKYSDAVGSSLESLAGQFSQLSLELDKTEGLPATVKAASNGVITPIYKFNQMLKDAINNGATPQEVAKAIEVGAKLSDVISNVLQVFSSINISSISTKADFITNIISGVTDTFKTSLLDQFKKTLVSPILGGLLDGTGNVGLTAGEIANAGDSLVARAEELLAILNNQNTSSALGLVGVEFEKLMKLFASLDVATSLTNINKVISDISSDLKISAFDFLVNGDAYSTSLFKAADSFKKAGVSEDLIYQPLSVVFDKVRTMISSSSVTADGINYLTEALKSMAEATKAARTQIANTVETTSNLVGSVFGSIKEISISMINSSGDIGKAKTILADLLTYPAEQVAKARSIYQKAKLSGNMLEIANAGSALSTQLSSYMADQISAQETLSKLAEDKYTKEKAALDDIINWTKELADFAKELKFDEKLSILAPINRLAEATKTFDQLKQDLLLKSNSSSLTAEDVKSIQEDGKRLLELGREVYASGDQYTALYTQVQALIASSSLSLSANQATLEQSTLAYQDSSLLFAAQQRDIQLSTLEELKSIGERAAYDNAISTQLLDAIKFNQSVPSGVVLSDYYAQLLSQAQSGIGSFTGVGTGFPDFTQGTATQQQTDSATAPTTTDLNARLVQTLERLEVVLAMLPLDMRNAVINQQSAVKRS